MHLGGPRHIRAQDELQLIVVSERVNTLTQYRWATDRLLEAWSVARLPNLDPESAATHAGAELRLSPNGQFSYASNRGESNSIVAYDLSSDTPTLLGQCATGSRTPRCFAIAESGDFLIVAHREAGGLQVFDIAEDGTLTAGAQFEPEQSAFFVGIWGDD